MTYRLYRLTAGDRQAVCWLGYEGTIAVGQVVVRDDDSTPWTVQAVGSRALDFPKPPCFTVVSVEG